MGDSQAGYNKVHPLNLCDEKNWINSLLTKINLNELQFIAAILYSIFIILSPLNLYSFIPFLILIFILTLLKVENGVIIVIFFAVFGVNKNILILNKSIFLAYIVNLPVMLGLYIAFLFRKKYFKVKDKPLFWTTFTAIIFFLTFVTLTSIFYFLSVFQSPFLALEKTFSSNSRFLIHMIEFFGLISMLMLLGKFDVKRAIKWLIIFAVLNSVLAMHQHFFGITNPVNIELEYVVNDNFIRGYGTLDQPNLLGGFLNLVLPFILVLSFHQKNMMKYFFLSLAFLICFAALFSSVSRASILSFSIVFLLLSAYHIVKGNKQMRMKVAFAFLFLFIAVSPFILNGTLTNRFGFDVQKNIEASGVSLVQVPEEASSGTTPSGAFQEAEFSAADIGVSARFKAYRTALLMIKNHLWFGIGPGNYESMIIMYGLGKEFSKSHIHNLYLQIGLEGGVFVLLLFLSIMFLFIICCLKLRKIPLVLASFASFLAFSINNLFDYFFHHGLHFIFATVMAIPFIIYYNYVELENDLAK